MKARKIFDLKGVTILKSYLQNKISSIEKALQWSTTSPLYSLSKAQPDFRGGRQRNLSMKC